MNKKLIALAVGSAIGALGASAAFAQSSSVSLSGNLNFNYGFFDNGGAGFTKGSGDTVGVEKTKYDGLSNQESNWRITGEEKLANGMAAFFQCETSMDITGSGAANMCNRNSFIGMKGGFGSVNFGTYDTPAKRLSGMYDPFPISAAFGQGAQMFNATTTSGNSNASGNPIASSSSSFSRRQNALITYDMPSMNGFDAAFAFSAANEGSGQNSASTIQKPRMWSAMVNYTNGPLGLGLGYENHHNYNPLNKLDGTTTNTNAAYTGGDDTMLSLGAGYKVSDALRLSAIWNSMKYDKINAAGQSLSAKTYGLYADWNFSGPYRVRAGYSVMQSTSGSYNGLAAATNLQLGVWTGNAGAGQTGSQKIHTELINSLSKRTDVGLSYARIANDRFSAITIGTGGANPNYGQTSTFMGMLIRHKF